MQSIDLNLISNITNCKIDEITFISVESYPCGMHNCCYYHVYQTTKEKYSIEMHCGCESQTVPDGSKVDFFIRRII